MIVCTNTHKRNNEPSKVVTLPGIPIKKIRRSSAMTTMFIF